MAKVGERVRVEVTYHAGDVLKEYRKVGVLRQIVLPDYEYHGFSVSFEDGVTFVVDHAVDVELIPLERS